MLNPTAPADVSRSRVARRKEKTKRTLLQVARRLFSDKGIYLATVEDITELADLGKGTFYQYFDSKETIIRVLLEEGLSEMMADAERAVREVSSNGKVLAAVIAARVDFFLKYPDYLLLLHQVRGLMQLQVAAAKDLREVYDSHLRRLATLVKPAIAPGGTSSARDVATAVAAYTSGILTYHVLFEGHEAVKRRREALTHAIERSVQALVKAGNGGRE